MGRPPHLPEPAQRRQVEAMAGYGVRVDDIAKVYKDKSWLDGKECIVLDYSDTSLVAQWIRDEIRAIEPGVYLGKVYWDDKRLIDFVLEFGRSRQA